MNARLCIFLVFICGTVATGSTLRDCGAALNAQALATPFRQNQNSNPVLYDLRAIRAALQKKIAARPPGVREIPPIYPNDADEHFAWHKANKNPTEEEWTYFLLGQNILNFEILEDELSSTSVKHLIQATQFKGRAAIDAYFRSLQTEFIDLAARAIDQHTPWQRPKSSFNPLSLLTRWQSHAPSLALVDSFAHSYLAAVQKNRATSAMAEKLNEYWEQHDLLKSYQQLHTAVGPQFFYAFSGEHYLARLQYDPQVQDVSKAQFLEYKRLEAFVEELNVLRARIEEFQDGQWRLPHPELEARQATGSVFVEFDFIASYEGNEPVLNVILQAGRPIVTGRPKKLKQQADAKEHRQDWFGAASPAAIR